MQINIYRITAMTRDHTREWFWNLATLHFYLYILIVVHTLKEKEFTDFIIKAQNDREKYVIMKKQLKVKFVPAIAQIIKQSCHISSKF